MGKIYRNYIALVLSLVLTACASANIGKVGPGETLVTCIHKYDSSRVVEYNKINITQFVINDVVTFYILDINGKDVFLNIYEIENYKCTEILNEHSD